MASAVGGARADWGDVSPLLHPEMPPTAGWLWAGPTISLGLDFLTQNGNNTTTLCGNGMPYGQDSALERDN